MATIWIDVTTTLLWSRAAVGIVRVEIETADHALSVKDQLNIKFCCFDKTQLLYSEVSSESVARAISRIRQGHTIQAKKTDPTISDAEQLQIGQPVPLTLKIERLLLLATRVVPEPHRSKTLHFFASKKISVEKLLQGFGQLGEGFKSLIMGNTDGPTVPPAHLSTVRLEASTKAATIFTSGDTYLSLGLDWDQKDLPYLYELKQQYNLSILLFAYDIIPVLLPHLCVHDVSAYFGRYFADLAWCADEVLCISRSTKTDLAKLIDELGTAQPQLEVVRLGTEVVLPNKVSADKDVTALLDEDYILFVSTIERRKNHETLYRAYTRLLDQGLTDIPKLVFVGMQGWGVDELLTDLRLDPRISDLIIRLNSISDSDLYKLYENAMFTVYPSLYEGWGLPVDESLAMNKFCLATNTSSVPEVGGDFVEYLDPWDVPAWAERLAYYFENRDEIRVKELAITQNYKQTTWSETANFVLERAANLHKNETTLSPIIRVDAPEA